VSDEFSKKDDSDPSGKRWRALMERNEESATERIQRLELLQDVVAEIKMNIVETIGKRGDGGTVGEVRRSVETINTRLWWALTFMIGCLGGIGAKVFLSGRELGRFESQLERLQKDTEEIRTWIFERKGLDK